jgi:hypothetical protein
MAQNTGLVSRGLLLLGMILILVTFVGFIVLRPADTAARADATVAQRDMSTPGWEVRYNATEALARRGSARLPLYVLAEILDEDQQMRNFLFTTADGNQFVDETAARRTVLSGLKALAEWLKHKDAVNAVATNDAAQLVLAAVPSAAFPMTAEAASNAVQLQRVFAAVDKLTLCTNQVVRDEAENVKKTMGSH